MTSTSDPQPPPDRPAVTPPDSTPVARCPLPAVNARHAVLAAVVDLPAATTVDLMTVTGFSRPAVNRALVELETAGLLRRELAARGPGGTGRAPDRWYPTEHADPAEIAAASNLARRHRITDRTAAASPTRHGLLKGLIDALPTPGTPLTADLRRQWMSAVDLALTLLYPPRPATDPTNGDPDQRTPDPTDPPA